MILAEENVVCQYSEGWVATELKNLESNCLSLNLSSLFSIYEPQVTHPFFTSLFLIKERTESNIYLIGSLRVKQGNDYLAFRRISD